MPDATHDTLREQLMYALTQGYMESGANADDDEAREAQADAVLVVFAERERVLRERIKALRYSQGSGEASRAILLSDVLAVFSSPDPYDEPMIGGPHEITNQYHPEPDRDPRQT